MKTLLLLLSITSTCLGMLSEDDDTLPLLGNCLRASSAYGYIYNLATTVPQTINSKQPIPFSSHSNLVGITHTAGKPGITIVTPGVYFVSFVVYAIQANQFALFLQQGTTVTAPVCNTNYGVGTAYTSNTGFAIVTTTVANAVLTLVNFTPFSVPGITPQTTLAYNTNGLACNGTAITSSEQAASFNGGQQVNTINAAVLIQRLD